MLLPSLNLFLWSVLAAAGGVSFVVQQAVNSDLRFAIGSAAWAGFASYLGGTLCMLLLALVLREPFPKFGLIVNANWWAWSGGLCGAVYIAISILLVPRLGAAFFVALLVAGQMIASIAFDHTLGCSGWPAIRSTRCG